VVETIAAQEGGIEEEESMPGVQVKWSADARDALREVTDAYLRRRAKARINRVPAGFMRDMTREEIEKVATERGVTTIDLAVCEDGIGHARQTMNEVIAGYVSNKKPR